MIGPHQGSSAYSGGLCRGGHTTLSGVPALASAHSDLLLSSADVFSAGHSQCKSGEHINGVVSLQPLL